MSRVWLVALVTLGVVVVGMCLMMGFLELGHGSPPHTIVVTPTTYGPPPA